MALRSVLITGGNGNLGRLVGEQLSRLGTKVISFDLPGTAEPSETDNQIAEYGDIRDTDYLQKLFETHRPEAVIHLASMLSGSSEIDPITAWEVNASASVALMRLAKDHGSGPFVFASTLATYGPGLPNPMPEDAPQWPHNIYGATKVAVERMGFYLKQKHGFDFRCLRFPFVLSPFAPPAALTAFASDAFKAAAKGEPFTFPVSPDTSMSALFLDDVTQSLVEFVQTHPDNVKQAAYNLHGFTMQAKQIAEVLRNRYQNFDFKFEADEKIDGLISNWPSALICETAKEDWGWSAKYDFKSTTEAMFQHFNNSN